MMVTIPGASERITQQGGFPSKTYYQFFDALATKVNYPAHGTTLQRPDSGVGVGFPYLDETLVKMIYVRTVNPVTWMYSDGSPA